MNKKYECNTLRYDPDIGWHWVFLQETNIKLKPFRPTKIEDIENFVEKK